MSRPLSDKILDVVIGFTDQDRKQGIRGLAKECELMETLMRDAIDIIKDMEQASGADCLYCDRDHGENFEEHSINCKIGNFLKATK